MCVFPFAVCFRHVWVVKIKVQIAPYTFLRNRVVSAQEVYLLHIAQYLCSELTIQCNSWYTPISAMYPEPSLNAIVLSPSLKRASSLPETFIVIAKEIAISKDSIHSMTTLTSYNISPCLVELWPRLASKGIGSINISPKALLLVTNSASSWSYWVAQDN